MAEASHTTIKSSTQFPSLGELYTYFWYYYELADEIVEGYDDRFILTPEKIS